MSFFNFWNITNFFHPFRQIWVHIEIIIQEFQLNYFTICTNISQSNVVLTDYVFIFS